MSHGLIQLLKSRRFGPLCATQFLGALNDNIYKNAIVILIAYRLGTTSDIPTSLLVTAAAGIFILPFFLFSATAGEVADRYDKARLIRLIKLAEIGIMLAGAVAFAFADLYALLTVLFLMGVHSAFFGPLKYGIIPDHVQENELVAANGLVEASTFIAIIGGTLLGGILVLQNAGLTLVSLTCIGVAVIGYLMSRAIPAAPALGRISVSWNIAAATGRILRDALRERDLRIAIFSISWFWFVGATWLAQVPNLAQMTFAGGEEVSVLFLVMFAVGIAVGSVLATVILRGKVRVRFAALAAGLLGGLSLSFGLIAAPVQATGSLQTAAEFLTNGSGIWVALNLAGIALAGGAFAVPLYALIQSRAPVGGRSRVIAALNIVNSAAMVFSALLGGALLSAGVSVPSLLVGVGVTGMIVMMFLWIRPVSD